MVAALTYTKFLKRQEIKEKIRLEKEAVEKRRKEAIEKYAQKRKLERALAEGPLAEGLETKLDMLERLRRENELRKKLRLKEMKKEGKKRTNIEIKLDRLERLRIESALRRELRLKRKEEGQKIKREEKEEKKTVVAYRPYTKTRDEFIFTEEDKAKCREKTLDELVDEIGGSQLVCPTGKEPKKDINKKELTADLMCFRKRIRRKSPEEIVALYDKLLAADPERLCKEKKE